MNDPPDALDRWPKGRHHLFIVAFSRFLYTHVDWPKEGGGRRSGQPQDYALSLQPKKWACLPSSCPPSPSLPSCSTYPAVDGRAALPLQTPRQLGSVLALSVSLPADGTVPTPTHRPFMGLRTVSPSEEACGGPLFSLFGDLWLALCMSQSGSKEPCPCPSGSQLGERGASLMAPPSALSAPE